MNISKLKKLKKWILAEPRRYKQNGWFYEDNSHVVLDQRPPCGTVGCLAGNACLMEGYEKEYIANQAEWYVRAPKQKNLVKVQIAARKILDLSPGEANNLFSGWCAGWPDNAAIAYEEARTLEDRAQAAAMAIDVLIETKRKSRRKVVRQ